jgi:hypothetical protein
MCDCRPVPSASPDPRNEATSNMEHPRVGRQTGRRARWREGCRRAVRSIPPSRRSPPPAGSMSNRHGHVLAKRGRPGRDANIPAYCRLEAGARERQFVVPRRQRRTPVKAVIAGEVLASAHEGRTGDANHDARQHTSRGIANRSVDGAGRVAGGLSCCRSSPDQRISRTDAENTRLTNTFCLPSRVSRVENSEQVIQSPWSS